MMKRSMVEASLFFFLFITSFIILGCHGVITDEKLMRKKKPGELRFAMFSGSTEFFHPVRDGWLSKCNQLGVSCIYQAMNMSDTSFSTSVDQCEYHLRKFMDIGVDGIATTNCIKSPDPTIFREITDAGIPIVTFDSDAPNSTRSAYVGTDNYFMGVSMARLLKQLRPDGGTYAVMSMDHPNLNERVTGFIDEISKDNGREDRAHWYDLPMHPDCWEMGTTERLESFALNDPTAIVTFYQTPMRSESWPEVVDSHRHRNITFIGTDGADYQLEYLTRRNVHGLIGQLPYDMGSETAQALYDLATKGELEKEIIGTNLVAYNLIPFELPTLEVDQNLLGNLKYVGFTYCGVVVFFSLGCIVWTICYRGDAVVLAAQPFFLMMIAFGVLVLVSALIPLSFDDMGNFKSISPTRCIGICMSIPWLAVVGFTFIISALLGKTWRLNKYYHSGSIFSRLRLTKGDVIVPFAILLTFNTIVLQCWTALDPLMYHREFDEGTDVWNREISSSGSCRSENAVAYLVPLGLINFMAVGVACWQAFEARDIESEFSESKYIGFALLSVAQVFLTGIPIVAVTSKVPETFYLVLTSMIFAFCVALLLLIFWPKFLVRNAFANLSELERRKLLAMARLRSSVSRRNPSIQTTDPQAASTAGSLGVCGHCGHEEVSSSGSIGQVAIVADMPFSDQHDSFSDSGSIDQIFTSMQLYTGIDVTPPICPPSPPDVRRSRPSYQISQESEVTIDA